MAGPRGGNLYKITHSEVVKTCGEPGALHSIAAFPSVWAHCRGVTRNLDPTRGTHYEKKSFKFTYGYECWEKHRDTISSDLSKLVRFRTWDEDLGRSFKKKKETQTVIVNPKREDSDTYMMNNIRKLIKNIDKEIRQLDRIVQDNINTKREIKESTQTLRSLSSNLMTTKMQELLGRMTVKSESVSSADNAVAEVGTQTDLPSLVEVECQTITATKLGINEEISKVKTFEDFSRLEKENWDTGIYKHAFIVPGTPLKANDERWH